MRHLWPFLFTLAAVAAEPPRIEYGKGRQICTLANEQIEESSGIACGRRRPDVLWTHNDSEDGPRVYAFNSKGEDLGTFRVEGAEAIDWEDMASCVRRGKSVLLIGDVGDNLSRRSHVTLYVVPEPVLASRPSRSTRTARVVQTIQFTYQDGPRDCEAVAVCTRTDTILLVEKCLAAECQVYALPWPTKGKSKPAVARHIATLSLPIVTGVDISPDGLRAVVVTYGHAFEYTRAEGEKWSDAFSREPRRIPLPARPQGEGIGYGPDGRSLFLTSEGSPAPLFHVPVVEPK